MKAQAQYGLALLCAVTILSACGRDTDAVDAPLTTTEGVDVAVTSTTTPSTTTSSTIDLSLAVLDAGLPRTGTYGFVDVTVEEAAIGQIVPASYLRDKQEPDEDTYLFLTMEVENLSLEHTANWTPSPYGLTISGQPAGAPIMLEGRPHIGLTPGSKSDAVVAFEIPADVTFDELAFTLAIEDTIPLVIPLTGEMPDWPWPIEVEVSGSADLEGEGISCGQAVTVEMLGGEVSVDLIDTESNIAGGRRALEGERFLTIDGRVTNHGGQRCGGGSSNVTGDSVRIVVDGVPRAPVGFVNQTVAPNGAIAFVWHFTYPVDASEVEIVFGDEDADHLRVPIDLSAANGQ